MAVLVEKVYAKIPPPAIIDAGQRQRGEIEQFGRVIFKTCSEGIDVGYDVDILGYVQH